MTKITIFAIELFPAKDVDITSKRIASTSDKNINHSSVILLLTVKTEL